jgi:glycine cleavage system H protein
MSEIRDELYYTKEHEYMRPTDEAGVFLVGITDYAQGEIGDIVFLELSGVGEHFGKQDVFGTVEAVKAVSDLYIPLSGTVAAVNTALEDDPALVNTDPYGDGWMIRLKLDDPDSVRELLDSDGYRALIE